MTLENGTRVVIEEEPGFDILGLTGEKGVVVNAMKDGYVIALDSGDLRFRGDGTAWLPADEVFEIEEMGNKAGFKIGDRVEIVEVGGYVLESDQRTGTIARESGNHLRGDFQVKIDNYPPLIGLENEDELGFFTDELAPLEKLGNKAELRPGAKVLVVAEGAMTGRTFTLSERKPYCDFMTEGEAWDVEELEGGFFDSVELEVLETENNRHEFKPGDKVIVTDEGIIQGVTLTLTERFPACDGIYGKAWLHTNDDGWLGEDQFELVEPAADDEMNSESNRREYKPGDVIIVTTEGGRVSGKTMRLIERFPLADDVGYGKAWLHTHDDGWLGEDQFELLQAADYDEMQSESNRQEFKPGDHVGSDEVSWTTTLVERAPEFDGVGYGKAWRHTHDAGWIGEAQVYLIESEDE